MNLIKISTDLELSVHEFPTGTHEEQNNKLRELIGNDCRLYEHVMPKRLYTELHQMDHPTKVKGQCVSMLIDEEGLLKEVIIPNLIGSSESFRGTEKRRRSITSLCWHLYGES